MTTTTLVREPDLETILALTPLQGIEDLTVGQLLKRLNTAIEEAGIEFGESAFSDQTVYMDDVEQPVGPYRWLECSAVRGGSEGYYIHLRRVGQPRTGQNGVLVGVAKTWTWKSALQIVNAATILLDR